MTTLLRNDARVHSNPRHDFDDYDSTDHSTPTAPTEEEWRAYCDSIRAPGRDPLPELLLPDASEWFRRQVAWHRERSRHESDYHDLIVCALNDALLALGHFGARGASDLEGRPGTPYREVVWAAVDLPREPRRGRLAEMLDEDAQFYLDMGHDNGRLAAYHILSLAELADRMGSANADEFVLDEAAWVEALAEVAMEAEYPGVMW